MHFVTWSEPPLCRRGRPRPWAPCESPTARPPSQPSSWRLTLYASSRGLSLSVTSFAFIHHIFPCQSVVLCAEKVSVSSPPHVFPYACARVKDQTSQEGGGGETSLGKVRLGHGFTGGNRRERGKRKQEGGGQESVPLANALQLTRAKLGLSLKAGYEDERQQVGGDHGHHGGVTTNALKTRLEGRERRMMGWINLA